MKILTKAGIRTYFEGAIPLKEADLELVRQHEKQGLEVRLEGRFKAWSGHHYSGCRFEGTLWVGEAPYPVCRGYGFAYPTGHVVDSGEIPPVDDPGRAFAPARLKRESALQILKLCAVFRAHFEKMQRGGEEGYRANMALTSISLPDEGEEFRGLRETQNLLGRLYHNLHCIHELLREYSEEEGETSSEALLAEAFALRDDLLSRIEGLLHFAEETFTTALPAAV